MSGSIASEADHAFMREALALAARAGEAGEDPVGADAVRRDGPIEPDGRATFERRLIEKGRQEVLEYERGAQRSGS